MPVTRTSGSPEAKVVLLGIRHHGPGSARAVRRALDDDPPDVVLIEGPGEADAIASLAAHPDMEPPVAMLGHVVDRPELAAFFPFASFSPEWVALRWACAHDVPVRFVDLALRHSLAPAAASAGPSGAARDPLRQLAEAAGYDDPERWWDDVVEHRGDARGMSGIPVFEAIGEAMAILRAVDGSDLEPVDPVEQRREASMRAGIRRAVADGFERIVVVCGAWHVPALSNATDPRRARLDAALLRGLPKVKAAITWVPWTHRRLASGTGYGAGVTAPGWYHHLFTHPGPDTVARWFTEAARVLRHADHATSAADVVEATRLAHALATLRERPLPGLHEVDDAARAALGHGTDTPMRLISAELVVGRQIGRVPASTPMVPLARDLITEQRRCRLKPDGATKVFELDLRKPLDLRRSHLLHRLDLLGVAWGRIAEGRANAGTFRETWELRWEPELEIVLIEVSPLGTTVVRAAVAAAEQNAGAAVSLAELTNLLERSLLAGLDDVIPVLVEQLGDLTALAADMAHLIDALTPIVRAIRYGDVRGTDAAALDLVVRGMVGRIGAGLATACTALDDDMATAMANRLREAHAALTLLAHLDLLGTYRTALGEIVERERVHGVMQGVATRLLADAGALDAPTTERRVSRALSSGTTPAEAAAFVEGFLGGAGAVLVHDAVLLGVLDAWIGHLDADSFTEALPLLRRTFGGFEPAERRSIGERVRTGQAPATWRDASSLDPERVALGLETIGLLLGVGS